MLRSDQNRQPVSGIQKSFPNRGFDHSKHEIFSQLRLPSSIPFFVRLDGRRFKAVSQKLETVKPFDERFAKCLMTSAKTMFKNNFNPSLVYVASDELNVLFVSKAPFNRRIEKINSVLSSLASSSFSLSVSKLFQKPLIASFDSRVIVSSRGEVIQYLIWRQMDTWRNHNNAYAYWFLRRRGYRPREAARKLRDLKTADLHEMLFNVDINLAQTPAWQRRGILVYREPYKRRMKNLEITRWRIKDNWDIPSFSSSEGQTLIQQILEWSIKERN